MNGKKCNLILLLAALSLVGLIIVGGCKESEPEGPSETVPKIESVTPVAIEQTTCPIMGMAIDKKVFVEYKGKKVYFCCPGCEDKFKAEPEKFLAKLPQFKN
ncbi:MAG: YHS domain-containing protein [Planctomycetota bacterium]|jgi:YHS domain-containing protein